MAGVLALFALLGGAHAHARQLACADVGPTLEAMRTADQALRHRIGQLQRATEQDQERIRKVTGQIILVDRINTAKLVALVGQCGWPRSRIHGEKAADHAWLIAQHADNDRTAQRAFLTHLKQAVDDGDSPAYTYAFLVDRIAMNEGKPQQYGTQAENKTPCDLAIVPLDDHVKADARRQAIGWPPLKDYIAMLTEHLAAQGCAAPRVSIGTELPEPLYDRGG